MPVCRRCYVSGRVQGVFFRASARNEAEQLGLRGYARNLPDGRVELLACGAAASSLEDFCAWLAQGPAHAQVTNVSCESVDEVVPSGFTVE